jgi:predicted component of type VI protein secretion system
MPRSRLSKVQSPFSAQAAVSLGIISEKQKLRPAEIRAGPVIHADGLALQFGSPRAPPEANSRGGENKTPRLRGLVRFDGLADYFAVFMN